MFNKLGAKGILLIISSYILLQLLWWAYIILDLQTQVFDNESIINKRFMIIGEGLVFVSILTFGFFKLNRSIKKEIQLSRQQQNFLLSVTHEIKTPLTALKLSLQTLAKGKHLNDITEQVLQHALKEQKRLEHFVDDIFAVNALEDHRWEESKSDLSILPFLEKIAENLTNVYPANHIHIQCPEISLKIDEKALHIVLSNLIENACKYSPFCGNVDVFVEEKNKCVYFHIKDQGDGIDVEYHKQVFDKFYRLGDEEKRKSKGSGLGLYLVKSFTHYLQGEISIASNQPKGSVFTIKLPR